MYAGSSISTAKPRGGDDAAGRSALFQAAQTVNIHGGHFNVGNQYNAGMEKAVQSILDAIPNYRDIHNTNLAKATAGTGPRFAEWKEYCRWLAPKDELKAMWGTGMPGAGKTIFASIAINKVELHARANTGVCVAYIYFRYSDHTTATIRDFLAVLVKQTIERHPACQPFAHELYARHIWEKTQPSEAELLHLLHLFTELVAATFYFLDGLDEAPLDVQFDLIEKLSSINVKIFITSRPLPFLEVIFHGIYRFPILAQDRDLDLHIKKEISRSPVLKSILNYQGLEFQEMITSTVKQKCGGMFLHASLQLDALRYCASVHDVEKTLQDFPPRIEDVYQRTWNRILDQAPNMSMTAKNVLVWVLCATRLLKIEELRCVVATCPNTHNFEPRRLVEEGTLMGLCCGLVNVEAETNIVQFVHYTAKEAVKGLISKSCPVPHSLPAMVCMAHLIKSGFQRTTLQDSDALNISLESEPLLAYAYKSWSIHAHEALDDPCAAGQLANFVQGCSAFPIQLLHGLEALKPLHMAAYFNFPLSVAGFTHLHDPNERTCHGETTPLILAIRQDSSITVKELLSLPTILVNAPDKKGYTPLMCALRLTSPSQVNWDPINKTGAGLLLSHPDINVNMRDHDGQSALMRASMNDADEAATLLLAHPNIQPNLVDFEGHTALMHASGNGSRRVVLVLLADSRTKVNRRSDTGKTALIIAQESGHNDIVQLLSRQSNRSKLESRKDLAKFLLAYSNSDELQLLLVATGSVILVGFVFTVAVGHWVGKR
ncbi:hypothetical protein BKA70DRAFT_1146650 [Coprinopsis sp. MPI-PUGE-AT-0042]|nr:hypothetical protein BKA70DRAFT_1146650 [Coprinopsis sp. MPI-PUGE-AT-0042]